MLAYCSSVDSYDSIAMRTCGGIRHIQKVYSVGVGGPALPVETGHTLDDRALSTSP